MKCPTCGAAVREIDRFCSECGSTLAAKASDAPCRACGMMVPEGAKFCGNCGASEPHSMAAGATGETVVARAPMRPSADTTAPAPSATPAPDASAQSHAGEPDPDAVKTDERRPTTPPSTTDDEDTGVFRRMIEEELEMTVDLGLDGARRGTGAPRKVTPDPTAEQHLGRPVGLALTDSGTARAKSPKPKSQRVKLKTTEKAEAVAAGPKRPVGLAKSPKRPKPAATGDKPTRAAEPEEPEIDVDLEDDDHDDVADDVADIWPDITEEVAEVRFYLLQGLEDDAKAALVVLKEKHGHHPELAVIEAELEGESLPKRRKKKGAKPAEPAKPGRARANAKPPVRTVPSPVVAVASDNLDALENDASPPEDVPPPREVTMVAPPPEPVASVPLARITARDHTLAVDGSEKVTAKPAPPSRTGKTVPMPKPPTTGKSPSLAPLSKPPPPPAPGMTTPRSTPGVPPIRKPPPREVATTPKSTASVPPPPMPVAPSLAKAARAESAAVTEVSGEVVPRGDTVVSAFPPEPPASGDRTMVTRGPQAPAPFDAETLVEDHGAKPQGSRNTLVPTTSDPDRPPPPTPFGGEPAPGSTLVPGTTPPPGGFADVPSEASSAVARHVEPTVTPPMPMAEPRGSTIPPVDDDEELEADTIEVEPEPRNETVIAAAPLPPAPFLGDAPTTLAPAQTIRLVMLGSRGQTVAERTIRPGDSLDVGRDPVEPWGDDEYLEERHARITPAAGGGVLVDDYDGTGPVFRQVSERTRIRGGDQLRVGQSLIQYEHGDDGWGRLLVFVNSEEPPKIHALGGSGASVGREDGDITFLDDTYVSGEHCRFLCEGSDVFVQDLQSSNGTYVRVRPGEPVELGSLLLLGHTQFRIRPA